LSVFRKHVYRLPTSAYSVYIISAVLTGCGGGTPATNPLASSTKTSPVAQASYTAFNYIAAMPGFTAGSITSGPDGALWFTAQTQAYGAIGRITTAGMVSWFPGPLFDTYPNNIASGPDGALWYTVVSLGNPDAIGRLTTTGTSTQYSLGGYASPEPGANAISPGPDGAMWFTLFGRPSIGRITPSGNINQFPLRLTGSNFDGITAGPDGALWFTSYTLSASGKQASAGVIGRITTAGDVRTYPLPPNAGPGSITTGPDGALWFAEEFGGHIGRITTSGAVTLFPLPSSTLGAASITSGPDGALWFIESPAGFTANAPGTSVVARMSTSGAIIEYPIPDLTDAGAMTTGPDGALWITSSQIWKLRP
jgi:virginiamycin B lyase